MLYCHITIPRCYAAILLLYCKLPPSSASSSASPPPPPSPPAPCTTPHIPFLLLPRRFPLQVSSYTPLPPPHSALHTPHPTRDNYFKKKKSAQHLVVVINRNPSIRRIDRDGIDRDHVSDGIDDGCRQLPVVGGGSAGGRLRRLQCSCYDCRDPWLLLLLFLRWWRGWWWWWGWWWW